MASADAVIRDLLDTLEYGGTARAVLVLNTEPHHGAAYVVEVRPLTVGELPEWAPHREGVEHG